MLPRKFWVLAAAWLWSTTAVAKTGVVVRLVVGEEKVAEPVVVHLTAGDEVIDVSLLDDGETPDVIADDNQFSGSTMIDGDDFDISLTMGDEKLDVGTISLPDDGTPRDLVITKGDGVLTVDTSAAGNANGPAGGEAASAGSAPAGGSPASGASPGGGLGLPDASSETLPGGGLSSPPSGGRLAGRSPNVTFPEAASSSLTNNQLILIGLGIVLIAALVFLWRRTGSAPAASQTLPSGVRMLPQPGPLGDITPALCDGLSVWSVPETERGAFLEPLLATLARHYRVLVVAPQRLDIPLVRGGPVYHSTSTRPIHVGDTAEALLGHLNGHLVVVILPDCTAERLKDHAQLLPPEASVIALQSGVSESNFPLVQIGQQGSHWRLTHAGNQTLISVKGGALSPLSASYTEAPTQEHAAS